MKEERNALQKEVFPKLRKLCVEHGFRFQAIDLRWGVSEEAGLDQQTMKICLEEIERSQKVSPKPNFIVLLGDRYGWRPLPYEIPADEFEEIKKVVSPFDKDFLLWEGDVLEDDQLKKREGWYCRDENAVPPVYCLKPRLVDYGEDASDDEIKEARDLEYKNWETIEKRLKSILLNAIDELGWNKDDPRRFKYESSATEQEIIKGVLNLPKDDSLSEEHVFSFIRKIKGKKSIYFDDYSKDFFDFTASGTIDASAEEKLAALKDKIEKKLSKSNRFDYETEWEEKGVNKKHIKKLCDDVYSSLEKVINEQINEFEDKDPLNIEIEAHKEFGEERCKFFKGRKDSLAQIKNYLDNPNSKPLIVYGESGSGKSALMGQAVEDLHPNFYKTPADNIIVRFIGATPESSDMRSLLEGLSKQISMIYGEDDSIPSDYNELVQHFNERLNLANDGKPLLIFLDALDQLSDSENAHNLSWIPNELPENVHIVISTLKNIFQSSLENRISAENTVEVLPLENNDGMGILDEWFKDYKRILTDKQEAEVINKFKVEGLPLYLKLAFEESKLWNSYTPVPELESDIEWMINNLFERLSKPENHGEMLVSRSLGYLSAAKNGLTEDEMLDILALDDDVFSLTRKFHEPTEDKLPVALWSRLYFDLEPYLTERSADATSLLAFYHRQLSEVATEKYLNMDVKTKRHQLITNYFQKQGLYFYKNEERTYNIRKVSELPYQQTYGCQWDNLEKTLTDLHFVEAKCAVGGTYELINDYNRALNLLPEAQKEKLEKIEHKKRVKKYTEDLVAYSKQEIQELEIIHSVKLWGEEKIKKDTARIIKNPTRLDRIKSFSQFVNSQSHAMVKFGYLPGFCIQQAYNSANKGLIAETARKIINETVNEPLILKKEIYLPEYNPHPAILTTLEGHTGFVNAVAVTPDGKKAVTGSDDHTVRVWDLKTGKNLKTLKGHKGRVKMVAVTPDGKKAVTANDNSMRVWDLETSKNLKTLKVREFKVSAVAVTPDGKKALIGGYSESVSVRDLETGVKFLELKGHKGPVYAVAVTPDGKKAVTGGYDRSVRVWDLETGKNIKTFEGHTGTVNAVEVTPDGRKAVTAGLDLSVFVWDLETGFDLQEMEEYTPSIATIAVTPDEKKVLSGSLGGAISWTWDSEKGFDYQEKGEYISEIWAVAVTPDGRKAVTGSDDHTVRVWDLETGKNLTLKVHKGEIKMVAVTPDGKKGLSVCGWEGFVRVWDLDTGKNVKTLKVHEGKVLVVAVTPDGRKAVTGSDDHTVRVWDLDTGKNLKTLKDAGQLKAV
ncbi:MAG: AAA family ATPase, partial [Methanobacterium sp.]